MSVQKASEVHSKLLQTVSKFLSPSLNHYFTQKVNNNFKKIEKSDKKEIEKYISDQNDLNDSLSRVIGIYNQYRDNTSTF